MEHAMRGRRLTPEVFRLLIRLKGREAVFADRVFRDFREAQGCVADAVLCGNREGQVCGIQLQRVMPMAETRHAGERAARPGALYAWITEKEWGEPVVRRILAQRRHGAGEGEPAARPVADEDDSALAGRMEIGCVARPPRGREEPRAVAHRSTRWGLLGASAFALGALGGLLVLQSTGEKASAAPQDAQAVQADLTGLVFRPECQPFMTIGEPEHSGARARSYGEYSPRGREFSAHSDGDEAGGGGASAAE